MLKRAAGDVLGISLFCGIQQHTLTLIMKFSAALVLSMVVAASWAAPQDRYNYQDSLEAAQYQAPVLQYHNPTPRYQTQYDNEPALYNFQWEVNDDYYGNYYGHQEQRDGPLTKGSYYVRLPDTRLMKVEYYVDEYGYHPTITYEGEAQYPQPNHQQGYQPLQNARPQGDLYL